MKWWLRGKWEKSYYYKTYPRSKWMVDYVRHKDKPCKLILVTTCSQNSLFRGWQPSERRRVREAAR